MSYQVQCAMVIEQCFRVTQPGGVFVICQQVSDSPEMMPVMESLKHSMNPITGITLMMICRTFRQAGFQNISTEVHFMSKYLIAHKPA